MTKQNKLVWKREAEGYYTANVQDNMSNVDGHVMYVALYYWNNPKG